MKICRKGILCCVVLAAGGFAAPLHAQDAAKALAGPNAVTTRLADDAQDKPDLLGVDEQADFRAWKKGFKERTGLDFGFDYNALGFAATASPGDDTAASGALRFFGVWELFQRGSENNGSLVFKLEHRHAYTDVAPSAFGSEIGYAGVLNCCFSDQGFRITHLFWQQRFADGLGVSYIGFLDVTDYLDVYPLASPWSGFSNLAFATGGGSIGGLPDGALGAMVGGFLTEHLYAVGSIVDANGDATDPGAGFNTFFNDFETFKSLEFGWTTKKDELFLNNAHLTFWQIDERTMAGTPGGWGANFSLSASVGNGWMPFLRGGWAKDGGSLYQATVSTGFGFTRNPGQSMLGLGLNWSRPNENTFGEKLGDQFAMELFQHLQLTEGFEFTPSIQVIKNPALNPEADRNVVFGLRARMAF